MKPFFDREDTKWRRRRGALHLYALPSAEDPLLDRVDLEGEALAGIPGLSVQPRDYIHATLQRLDAYEDELAPGARSTLTAGIDGFLRRRDPFTVRFRAPEPRANAVEAIGQAGPEWSRLIRGLREAVETAGLRRTLAEPPFGPHYTVAYCTDPTSDEEVRAALEPAAAETSLLIERVVLVAVHQHPEDGIFTFDRLHEWSLGSAVPSDLE